MAICSPPGIRLLMGIRAHEGKQTRGPGGPWRPLAAPCRHPGKVTGSPPSLKPDPETEAPLSSHLVPLASGLQLAGGCGAVLSSSTVAITSQGVLRFLGSIYGLRNLWDRETTHLNNLTVCNPSFLLSLATTWKLGSKQRDRVERAGPVACLLAHGRPQGSSVPGPRRELWVKASDRGGAMETNELPGRENRMWPVSGSCG